MDASAAPEDPSTEHVPDWDDNNEQTEVVHVDPVAGIHGTVRAPTAAERARYATRRAAAAGNVCVTACRAKPALSTAVVLSMICLAMCILALFVEWFNFQTTTVADVRATGRAYLGQFTICTIRESTTDKRSTGSNTSFESCLTLNRRTCLLTELPDIADELKYLRDASITSGIFTFFTILLGGLGVFLNLLVRTNNLVNYIPEQIWFLRNPMSVSVLHGLTSFTAMIAFSVYVAELSSRFSFESFATVFPQLLSFRVAEQSFGAGLVFLVLTWLFAAVEAGLIYRFHNEHDHLFDLQDDYDYDHRQSFTAGYHPSKRFQISNEDDDVKEQDDEYGDSKPNPLNVLDNTSKSTAAPTNPFSGRTAPTPSNPFAGGAPPPTQNTSSSKPPGAPPPTNPFASAVTPTHTPSPTADEVPNPLAAAPAKPWQTPSEEQPPKDEEEKDEP